MFSEIRLQPVGMLVYFVGISTMETKKYQQNEEQLMAINIQNFNPRLEDTPYPDFECPSDDQPIWRYLTIEKFKSLITQQALWFARVDTFDERFEGAIPLIEAQKFEKSREDGKFDFLSYVYGARTKTAASCWHMNTHESVAMWNLYLKEQDGVAIKSTYNALRTSIKYDELESLFAEKLEINNVEFLMAKIRYIDHFNDEDTEGRLNVKKYFFQKYVGYKHESELRALVMSLNQIHQKGFLIPIRLNTLIHEIYLSPNCHEPAKNEVELLLKASGLDVSINTSKIAPDSFYIRQVATTI